MSSEKLVSPDPRSVLRRHVESLLSDISRTAPEERREANRQKHVSMFNSLLRQAKEHVPEVAKESWPEPFLIEEVEFGVTQYFGSDEQVRAVAERILELLPKRPPESSPPPAEMSTEPAWESCSACGHRDLRDKFVPVCAEQLPEAEPVKLICLRCASETRTDDGVTQVTIENIPPV